MVPFPSSALRGPFAGAACVLTLTVILLAPSAAAASDLLPDLVQQPPTEVQIGGSASTGWQIGFQSEVMNQGAGPLEIHGHRSSDQALMTADQVIYQSDGGAPRTVPGVGDLHYETGFGHEHWHFEPFDHYELRTLAGALVGTDQKQGFCLGDNKFEGGPGPHVYGYSVDPTWCQKNNPSALQVTEGISVGWGDPYDPLKEGQDIPIDQTTVPAGDYNLVHRVNENSDGTPEAVVEQSFANNVASAWVRIAWSNGTPSITVLQTCTSTASCGPVPPPRPPTSGTLGAGPVKPLAATAAFPRVVSLGSLLRHGLRVRVHCSRACRLRVALKPAHGAALGSVTTRFRRAGSRVVRLRLKPKAKRALRHTSARRLVLQIDARATGGQHVVLKRSLRLRP